MPYSTKEQVREVLKGLANTQDSYDVTPDDLSDTQVEYEIRNADNQIDLSLRRHYRLPLPEPIPPILNILSVDIAVALCDMTYRGSREYASELSPIRLRYQRAIDILERIAEGIYPIYNEDEGPERGGAVVINPYPGDVLLTKEVFPRGIHFPATGGEFGERVTERYPYHNGW